MIKRIGRRFVSLLLTFVTILTLLPAMTLPALAATSGDVTGLSNTDIGLSFSGNADKAWSASGDQITGSAKSTSGCYGQNYNSTLTITNKKTTPATLSFDYTIEQNGGTIQVDGASVTAGGTFSKELASDASINVSITSGSDSADTKITMTNVKLVADVSATVIFRPAEHGSYTVDGNEITAEYTKTQSSMNPYRVEATPADGYRFKGWYDVNTGACINTNATAMLNFDHNCTITARFVSKDLALFETGGQQFDDLNEAVTYAQANSLDKITLASNGKITGNYTIPSGVTLLIPFDKGGTLYTDTPDYVGTYTTPSVFRKLTMAPNSSITVNGAISVGGKHCYVMQKQGPSGPYGQIDMAAGSTIVLNSSANLYAWGYITGDGQITATSGSTVYEYFQMMDFRGGQATLAMRKNEQKVFPISQYYVQNIEAALTLQAGAREITRVTINAAKITTSPSINFIGDGNSLFRIYDGGTLTKKYDPETDRITYTTTGKASLDSLALKVAIYDIDSKNFVLPVNNNMTLEILSGSVEVNSDAALLPGAQITIARGAELNVTSGKSLYVYDKNQWKAPYVYSSKDGFVPIPYSPSKKGKRTLANAKIDVNGTLTAAGSVYTTESGADICSSEGGGRFVQQGNPGTNRNTYQCTQTGTDVSYVSIPITAAQLKNDNGSYIKTSDYSAGATFTYCKCQECKGKWVPNLMVAEFNAKQYGTLQEAADDAKGASYVRLLHSTTEKIKAQNDLYLDLNGYTVTGDFDMAGYTLYGMDSSVKGYDDLPTGKIVGGVSGYAKEKIYQTAEDKPYDRYVAVLGMDADTKTPTLSFHRFNISVTGYRFELATGDTPQCALFFIGKFQGDTTAKDYLTSLGFTLTDNIDGTTKNFSCAKSEFFSAGAEGETTVISEDGAYLFEAYLMRDIDKTDPATYQTQFGATAQATFNNNGTQSSEQQHWSFQDAWENPGEITEKQQKILTSFLAWLDTPQSNGVNEHDE